MKLVDDLREKPVVKKIEKFFPAIAFLAGFGWDSWTLGHMVYGSDLLFLLAYYLGALIFVVLLSAHLEHPEGWTRARVQAAALAKRSGRVPESKSAQSQPAHLQTPSSNEKPESKPQVKSEWTSRASAFLSRRPERLQEALAASSAAKAKISNLASKITDSAVAEAAASKIRSVADASVGEVNKLAGKAASEAGRLADKVGFESTAIPQNAIVVHHRFLDREWSESWKSRFSWVVQFCFGSLFSALVVCYFKSSGSIASLVLVILLACLLVGNEFLQKKYESFGVSLAFFCLLGTMFMNFTIPHLVHRIGLIWFLISTILSLGICVGIQRISHRSKKVLVAPIAISALLIVAYVMNWVPPVPLVLKQQLVCQNFDKNSYSCDADLPSFWQKVGLKAPSVHRPEGGEVYFLAAVYAPAELKAELEFRWYYKDPATGKYLLTDKVSSGRMKMRGGREAGFRSFARKRNPPEGKYRVETAYKDGAVIGALAFDVVNELRDSTGYVRDSLR